MVTTSLEDSKECNSCKNRVVYWYTFSMVVYTMVSKCWPGTRVDLSLRSSG